MDRRVRRAPDAEWVLMYRSGLSRARIAALVRVPPAAIGYHLVIARRQDPGLESEHRAAAGTLHPTYRDGLARVPGWDTNPRHAADEARWHDRLAQLVAFRAEGHDWPRHHDYDSDREHALGVWIHTQRYTRRAGDLDPAKLKLLDEAVPGWQTGRTRGRPPFRP
ncbi:helicase associated domain-containing protein [Pseudarthrobacter sp. SSS035]|uniref:helicase associated domain-containing protein n=1 Tax=Pseudarthrobacter sp. SSS035 TaxID=2931399 RepID=UPI00200FF282|nr:helicase associated domain-containing protein [Pseudarthrobacter sp. SSS035]